jgi:hypothetical protein
MALFPSPGGPGQDCGRAGITAPVAVLDAVRRDGSVPGARSTYGVGGRSGDDEVDEGEGAVASFDGETFDVGSGRLGDGARGRRVSGR